MNSRWPGAAIVGALSLIVSGASFGQTNCKWVQGGFPYSVFEIDSGAVETRPLPRVAFPPVEVTEFWRSLQRIQEKTVPPAQAEKQLPRLVYRLRVVDQRCRLSHLGWHATAVLSCNSDEGKVDIDGLLDLGEARSWPGVENDFRSARGVRSNISHTWHERPYDRIETPDDPIEVKIGDLRGLVLYQMASRRGSRTHDVISFAVRGGCVGLHMRLETRPSSAADAGALIRKVTEAVVVDALTEEENRKAETRDIEEFKRREAEDAKIRPPPKAVLPSNVGVPPVGPNYPRIMREMPLLLQP
jgi:hypothetical protein